LFNALTHSDVYEADKLFATLDPTLGQLPITPNFKVILADTVGFVKDLPHTLVDAFKSTLIETQEAHLLIHVIDASDEQRTMKIESVNEVLQAIGAENVPQLEAYNKVDMLPYQKVGAEKIANRNIDKVWLSAHSGEGLDALLETIKSFFLSARKLGSIKIDNSLITLKEQLYKNQLVINETYSDDGTSIIEYDMPISTWGRYAKEYKLI
jgi:GTP-binding protein HflX